MKSCIDKVREEQASALIIEQRKEIIHSKWLSVISIVVSIAALIVSILK